MALKILACPDGWTGGLDELVSAGLAAADATDPFGSEPFSAAGSRSCGRRLFCDAVIPRFDPARLWLSVYAAEGEQAGDPAASPDLALPTATLQRLDAFPLSQATNESCWFFPTDDGAYLACESRCRLQCRPGYLPDGTYSETPIRYDRGEIRVLWSLMADDEHLSCVGFTYQSRRIEFPIDDLAPAPSATWTSFLVDTTADPAFERLSTISTYR